MWNCWLDRALGSGKPFGEWHCGWNWLIESSHRKGISCQAAEGELQPVRQGRKET